MQLNEDGYTLIQNTKNSWRVEKQINGTTTYLTIYPFNEKGECTVNVNSIKGLFNAYEKLKNAGYTITCEGKTNQISGNVWNISKGNITISVQAFDDNGKINVSINNINKFFKEKEEQAKFETAISKLSKDGYRVIHDAYNNDAWVIEKKINGTNLNERIFGTSGNDKIKAGGGDDVIYSGVGNDKIYGGKGNDTYVFGTYKLHDRYFGSGNDVIYDAQNGETIEFTDSNIEDLTFTRSKNKKDLIITYRDMSGNDTTENTVTVKNYDKNIN